MKKYKLLHYGHAYITKNGDFAITLIGGNRIHGYIFQASHTCRNFITGKIYIRSRIVPNDGYWIEIPPLDFVASTIIHGAGYLVKVKG